MIESNFSFLWLVSYIPYSITFQISMWKCFIVLMKFPTLSSLGKILPSDKWGKRKKSEIKMYACLQMQLL